MSYPSLQKALKITKDQSHLELREVPVPDHVQPNEILVKVQAAGLTAVDTYLLNNKWVSEGCGSGVELSGEVIKIGSEVTRFEIGDSIAAFTFGSDIDHPENGAYQQYAKVLESNSFHFELKPAETNEIPESTISTFEGGASVASTLITVGISIHHVFGGHNKNKTLLIYGGSTSTGKIATIYAHYLGWRVISIASSKHHESLKEIGADVTIDYHTNDLTRDIVELKEDIDYVYVTTGGPEPVRLIHDALPTNKEIKMECLVVPDHYFISDWKSNIKFDMTRAFTSHGKTIHYANGFSIEPVYGTLDSLKEWVTIAESLNKKGLLKHNPVKVLPHGLNSVNNGLDLLSSGERGNTRLVIRPYEE